MVVGGPIYFFQHDETEYVRRPRKSLALVESLEDDGNQTKQESTGSKLDKELVPGKGGAGANTTSEEPLQGVRGKVSLYNQNLVSKIQEDAKLFIQQDSVLSATPSLHKFLPLLKQAILTFDMIDPPTDEKITLHEKYQNYKPLSGKLC